MERRRRQTAFSQSADHTLQKRAKVEQKDGMELNGIMNGNPQDKDEEEVRNSYERQLLKNIRENELFLKQLGIDKVKDEVFSRNKKPTNKGLKIKKEPIAPTRSSMRLRRMNPDGTALPELPPAPELETEKEPERKASGPLDICETFYQKTKDEGFVYTSELQKVMRSEIKDVTSKKQPDILCYVKSLKNLKITENGVRKVVPSRIFSVAIHPNCDQILAVCGDKWGRLGFWFVESSLPDDGVCCFEPHVRPINHIEFQEANSSKLFSSSYDGTMRCLDVNKGVFNEIYATPKEDDIRLSYFSFFTPDTLVTAQSDGNVGFVDCRTPGTNAEHLYKTHNRSIKCVNVHPVDRQYFVTSGRDCVVSIWDSRKMNKKTQEVVSLKHKKLVDSAYFSPLTGCRLISTSLDDMIRIFDTSSITNDIEIQCKIRHYNNTGRWLSNFRAVWHPRREDLFIVGSMNRPRQIEMYNTSGEAVFCFKNEDYLNSVCSLNAFHPLRDVLVGGNSSGRMFAFL